MGEWISSKEFTQKYGLNKKSLEKAAKRAAVSGKKICKIKFFKMNFRYIQGKRGGKAGKVLQIWSEPLSLEELEMFESDSSVFEDNQAMNSIGSQTSLMQPKHSTHLVHPIHSTDKGSNDGYKKSSPMGHSKSFTHNANIIDNHSNVYQEKGLDNGRNGYGCVDFVRDDCVDSNTIYSSGVLPSDAIYNRRSQSNARRFEEKIDNRGAELIYDKGVEIVNHKEDNSPQALSLFGSASLMSQEKAMLKLKIIKEWQKSKGRLKEREFIIYINDSKLYPFSLSASKLYAWQRDYRNFGIDGLIDERGKHRAKAGIIENNLVLKDIIDRLILASKARFNLSNIYELAHMNLSKMGLFDFKLFLSKEAELFSYNTLKRYVERYLENNKILKAMVEGGESKADSCMLPAVGRMDWNVDTINQIVEIDATSIDAILDVPLLCKSYGFDIETMERVQKRYVLIALIDVYSRVCIFQLADTENSLGVSRAIAKYIKAYGKPRTIRGDNGRAFRSAYVQEVCLRLGIEFVHTAPYSGWLKPYVESNFKKLQHKAVEWMSGYIGHSVGQRKSIEEFDTRKERRLKKGEKTYLKNLLSLEEFEEQVENYNKIALNKYNATLGDSPINIYNAKSDEAISLSDYELSTYLSVLKKKSVNKKGVCLGGITYQLPSLYKHSSVYVGVNINNIAQAFIYDKDKQFIDIALAQNTHTDTMEIAKASRKIYQKTKKALKKKMIEARMRVEAETPLLYKSIANTLLSANSPQIQPINTQLEDAKSRSIAKMASGGEWMEKISNMKEKDEKTLNKKRVTWEDIASKKA
ncbi:DDE-type integrase/transposase/recombinase [Helicobacter sp. 13S00477-4]|uniref:DDE-type integrase/transposase/recombinase n=1 Tax=Helicobacter sp. 13S00477-4 TaxID=1905759 RepID=UPI000BA53F14|nr:DDE-type integrase/transposase/recombinase [Helicobacter sp. 13S00477-4]PAF51304.1 hypothetical protein BKH44_06260 [Helicobacter sp. 13S00477-4]